MYESAVCERQDEQEVVPSDYRPLDVEEPVAGQAPQNRPAADQTADDKDSSLDKDEGGEPRRSVTELTSRELGMRGEDMAAKYLEDRGWQIISRNWRCNYGEVDIIARDETSEDEPVVLVEVKTRLALGARSNEMPELAVNAAKRKRYCMMALSYLVEHPIDVNVRFDVIALNIVDEGQAKLRHLVGAFEFED